jgi:hypothetical protein
MPTRRTYAAFTPMVTAILMGCATAPERREPEPAAPEACRAPVARAEDLGRAIFEQEEISAWATDALLRERPRIDDVLGWVTSRDGAGWAVHFFGRAGDRLEERYTARFARAEPGGAVVELLDPPRPLAAGVAAMALARQTAIAEPLSPQCSDAYNTVVLPGALGGEEGWLVYLLAATTQRGVMVAGGHHRRTVSADGARVVRSEPLSRACLALPPPPPGATGGVVTHIVTPCPVETHVYLSLLHRRPLYVGTSTGTWAVEQGRIRYVGPPAEHSRATP